MATKAEKNLAKKLAREEKLMQIRKDTLLREQALDKLTLTKIKDKWFETLTDTKVPQMQDNLKQTLYYMEKLIESENFRKLTFEDQRQELEEKTTLMSQSHESDLATLFDIYQNRVQVMNDAYDQMVHNRKTEAELELKAIEEKEIVTQDNMNTMLFRMQENKEKTEEMMNCDMFLKLDDERSKNTEVQENLQLKLEKKMEKRWGEISSTLSRYEYNTKERRKEYLMLKAKDDAESKVIHQQMKKTQKLFEQLEELKKCLDYCYAPKETISLIDDLTEERKRFFKTFKELKRIVEEELKDDKVMLKHLTMITNNLTSDMRKITKKGEQVLTLFRICRRLETQYEKVLPMGNPYNFAKLLPASEGKRKSRLKTDKEEHHSYTAAQGKERDFDVFEKFWVKVGKVRLSKVALAKCNETLEKENLLLKRMIASRVNEVTQLRL